jgi:hypothetical protein
VVLALEFSSTSLDKARGDISAFFMLTARRRAGAIDLLQV